MSKPAWVIARFLWVIELFAIVLPLVAVRLLPGASALAAIAGTLAVEAAVGLLVVWRCGSSIREARQRQRALHEARLLCHKTRRILRRRGYRIEPRVAREIAEQEQTLRQALVHRDIEGVRKALGVLDESVDAHLAFARKSTVREYAESVGVAVLIALLLRSFVVEAFKIPSGSMIPTLEVGDHIFVNKFIYGLGWPLSGYKFWTYHKPRRGEVIVFKYPPKPSIDYIKRVIAVEGDTVEVRDGRVWLNGRVLPRSLVGPVHYLDISEDEDLSSPVVEERTADEFEEEIDGQHFDIYLNHTGSDGCPPRAVFGCRGPARVPADHVFVMGDNRDNSSDSRFWGFVPDANIKGKALVVWYSGDPTRSLAQGGVRFRRIGTLVR